MDALMADIRHYLAVVAVLFVMSCLSVYLRRRSARKKAAELAKRRATPAPKKYRPLPPVQQAVGVPVEHLPNPYPPYTGTLRIHDPLRDNSAGYQWMNDSENNTQETEGCHFCEESYRVSIGSKPTPWFSYCLALETNFSNFVYQVETTLLQGSEIGLVFRQTAQYGYYYFYIRRDGSYGLLNAQKSIMKRMLLIDGLHPAIKTGLNETNVLAVVANGPDIDLYVNQQHIAHVRDDTHPAGRISLGAATDAQSPCEASFRNVRLWTLDDIEAQPVTSPDEGVQQLSRSEK
jgi:hypothetical protein